MGKRSFHLEQEKRLVVDIFCQAESEHGPDLVVEVKDWDRVDSEQVEAFIRTKTRLEARLTRPTVFLFHGERGLTQAQKNRLKEAGITYSDGRSFTS